MSDTPREWKYLERREGSNFRQLFIKGRRIRDRSLYGDYTNEEEALTPEEIAEAYQVPLEAVREAIAYCETDPPEIREDLHRHDLRLEAMGRNRAGNGKPRPLSPDERRRIYGS